MAKSENLKDEPQDKQRLSGHRNSERISSESRIVVEEVLRFKELVRGHKRLIEAIGRL